MPDAQTVQDVDVNVNITHTWDGDLVLSLITPTGTVVPLSNRRGSSGDNYTNTVFSDEAATPISGGSPPFTGSFRPESPLSVADGGSSLGAWRFKVVDQAGSGRGHHHVLEAVADASRRDVRVVRSPAARSPTGRRAPR